MFDFKGATSRYFESFLPDGLNYGSSVEKPKNNGLLRKKYTNGLIRKQKRTRMVVGGEDWNGLEITTLKSLANFFKVDKRCRSSCNDDLLEVLLNTTLFCASCIFPPKSSLQIINVLWRCKQISGNCFLTCHDEIHKTILYCYRIIIPPQMINWIHWPGF